MHEQEQYQSQISITAVHFREDIGKSEDYTTAVVEDIKGHPHSRWHSCVYLFCGRVPQVRLNNDYDETLLHLSKYMNTDLVWIHPSQTVKEGLAFTLNQMGIPTMVTESGAAFRIRYEYCHLDHR